MSLAVLSASYAPIHPYGYEDDRPVVVARMAGGASEQRATTASRKLRRYTLRFRTTAATRLALDAFFEARGYTAESFLWKDLKDYSRTGITLSPATGNGVATVFTIPTTGMYGGDYPIDQAGTLLKVAGVSVTRTVQTDARTLTAAAAPGASAITADYEFYKRVRLAGPYSWSEPVYGIFDTTLVLQEVAPT